MTYTIPPAPCDRTPSSFAVASTGMPAIRLRDDSIILQTLFGMAVLIALTWLISEDRRGVRLRGIVIALLVQVVFAFLMLRISLFKEVFQVLSGAVASLEEATRAGTSFVFGFLGGADLPFDVKPQVSSFVLAFQALPLVLVVSALSSLFFYWRILPVIVRAFSWALQKTMGVGGAVGLGAAANVFLGMVEAPLFIRPYLRDLTRSELFITMSCGMAGIAGTVMVLYASILRTVIPDAMGHILTASIVTIPAAIMFSMILIPETDKPTSGRLVPPRTATSGMDAITKGTIEGTHLLINIVAMLIVLVALVSLANQILGLLPHVGEGPITLQRMLGTLMAPLMWLIGIPWSEAQAAGALMGTKTILNEFIAYLHLAGLPEGTLSPRSTVIMTYALCGFANLGSLGIMIGGMGSMVPERRGEIIALGMKSLLAGTLATCMAGAIAGLMLPE